MLSSWRSIWRVSTSRIAPAQTVDDRRQLLGIRVDRALHVDRAHIEQRRGQHGDGTDEHQQDRRGDRHPDQPLAPLGASHGDPPGSDPRIHRSRRPGRQRLDAAGLVEVLDDDRRSPLGALAVAGVHLAQPRARFLVEVQRVGSIVVADHDQLAHRIGGPGVRRARPARSAPSAHRLPNSEVRRFRSCRSPGGRSSVASVPVAMARAVDLRRRRFRALVGDSPLVCGPSPRRSPSIRSIAGSSKSMASPSLAENAANSSSRTTSGTPSWCRFGLVSHASHARGARHQP